MKWVLIAAGSLAGLAALAWIIGLFLPKGHSASRTLRLKQSPEAVWTALTDYAAMPSWRADLAKVEQLPDHDGHPVWRETLKRGMAFPLETIESAPPRRLVRRIADPKLPFGGTWTYEIALEGGGSTVRITEDGEIRVALFRVMMVFMSKTETIETFLSALARKFGEEPSIR